MLSRASVTGMRVKASTSPSPLYGLKSDGSSRSYLFKSSNVQNIEMSDRKWSFK